MIEEAYVSFDTAKLLKEKDCTDCWHNYHCPMPQEGYDYNPDTCPYNPDNEMRKNWSNNF